MPAAGPEGGGRGLQHLRLPAGLLLALAVGYVALVVGAATRTSALVIAAALVLALAGVTAGFRVGRVRDGLELVGLGAAALALAYGLPLVLFAARTSSTSIVVATTVAVALAAALRALAVGERRVVAWLRTPLYVARGFPLGVRGVPRALPRWVTRPVVLAALGDLVLPLGLAIARSAGARAWAVAGLVACVALSAVPVAILGVHALRLLRSRPRWRVGAAVLRELAAWAPEVVVYFGNSATWRYQLEMWLPPLERVGRRVLVVVRDRAAIAAIAPTGLPIVCIANSGLLMGLELPELRTSLFVGNAANNIHVLRRPDVSSVFIGHGDSDKAASSNPFSRVYDEIWVAGDAGRERYAHAGLHIDERAIVEIGRPQVGAVPRLPDAVPMLTVLYAPTWEGWGEDPFHSSLSSMGPDLVRALLARPDVRVMYRPHPRTGHRDPAIRRAHLEVVRLLTAAGADPHAGARPGAAGPAPRRRRGDALDLIVSPPDTWSREGHEADRVAWTERYWAANPGHRILTEPAPGLHDCFTMTDVLVADVSSVTSDFLAADRPYAVLNTSTLDEAHFREQTPSSAGGFVLAPGLEGLPPLLAAATGDDPTAAAREVTRARTFGPRTADPTESFRRELDRLCETRPRHRGHEPGAPDRGEVAP